MIILLNAIFLTLATNGLSTSAARELLPEPQGGPVATSFFPGTVPHDYQEKYEQFQAYDAAREAQLRRGWNVRRGWLGEPVVGEQTPFRVEVRDGRGRPLEGARVQVDFMRPASSKLDFDVTLSEIEPGVYQAMVRPTRPGKWDVLVDIERGDLTHQLKGETDVAAP